MDTCEEKSQSRVLATKLLPPHTHRQKETLIVYKEGRVTRVSLRTHMMA